MQETRLIIKKIIFIKNNLLLIYICLTILTFLCLMQCSIINTNEETLNEEALFLNLLLAYQNQELSIKDSFPNHDYFFSVKRDKTISGEVFSQCIDILKLNSIDSQKIITKYDNLERTPRCRTNENISIRCISTATIYVDLQNFINLSNEKLNSSLGIINTDCKDIEKGIIAF